MNAPAILHNLPAPRTLDECLYPSHGPEHFDEEFDRPEYHDPKILAELDKLQRRKMTTSPAETVEAWLQKWEENYDASKPQQWKGQERWQGRENEDMRVVRIMHPHTFIHKLRRAGVDARIEDDRYGRLWLNDFSRKGRIGISAWMKDEAIGRKVVKTVTTLQYPCGPEYSVMRFNTYNVPTTEKYRGWRTALLTLILADVITEREADQAFGPAEGEAAHFYRQQAKGIRGMRLGLRI